MIYKSTGDSEKQQMHKKAFIKTVEENLKAAKEITAIFWPNRSK